MAVLSSVAKKIRSKNAGPYWVTIDIFFADQLVFQRVSDHLDSTDIAALLQVDRDDLKRYDLADISVIKFSFPRRVVQGGRFDRDMHGAQYACVLSQLEISL